MLPQQLIMLEVAAAALEDAGADADGAPVDRLGMGVFVGIGLDLDTTNFHFRWTAGEHLIKGYTADNGTTRGFCSNCGSSLTFSSPNADPDLVEIALGCFDGEVPIEPDAHIFVASGARWADPQDDLPRYEAGRDSKRIG